MDNFNDNSSHSYCSGIDLGFFERGGLNPIQAYNQWGFGRFGRSPILVGFKFEFLKVSVHSNNLFLKHIDSFL